MFVFGDLDGGMALMDAIVVLVSSGGRKSGIFYQLVAVTQRNGHSRDPGCQKFRGIEIKINQINITKPDRYGGHDHAWPR